jgi:hypothetical protein
MGRGGRQIKTGQGSSTQKPHAGSGRPPRNARDRLCKGGVPSRLKTSDF